MELLKTSRKICDISGEIIASWEWVNRMQRSDTGGILFSLVHTHFCVQWFHQCNNSWARMAAGIRSFRISVVIIKYENFRSVQLFSIFFDNKSIAFYIKWKARTFLGYLCQSEKRPTLKINCITKKLTKTPLNRRLLAFRKNKMK